MTGGSTDKPDLPRFLQDAGIFRVILRELTAQGMNIEREQGDFITLSTREDYFERLVTLLHEFNHSQYSDMDELEATQEDIRLYNTLGVPVPDSIGKKLQGLIDGDVRLPWNRSRDEKRMK